MNHLLVLFILLVFVWPLSISIAYWVGLGRREEDVISNYQRQIRRDEERLAARKARIANNAPRVRDAKIRSTRRGYYGEEVEEDS